MENLRILIILCCLSTCLCHHLKKHWLDYTYKEETDSFYKIYNTRKSWLEARDICEEEGSLLFYPEDRKEAEMVREWWGEVTDEAVGARESTFIHIGLNENKIGHFETVDGIPIEKVYHNWMEGEPNNYGPGEDCVDILYDLRLIDSMCDFPKDFGPSTYHSHIPFVCKKRAVNRIQEGTTPPSSDDDVTSKHHQHMTTETTVKVPSPGDCSNLTFKGKDTCKHLRGYQYVQDLKNFYKIYNEDKSWVEADEICKRDGAVLFYPANIEELNVLKSWWSDCSGDNPCMEPEASILLGATTDADKEGEYKTVDGIPLEEVYHNWLPGQPDNNDHGTREDCLHLNLNQALNDIDCHGVAPGSQNPFICKQRASSLDWNLLCNLYNTEKYVDVCINFCYSGTCTISENGKPKCSCDEGYSGPRCEGVGRCEDYCLNNGTCSFNEETKPICKCTDNLEGKRCEKIKIMNISAPVHQESCTNYSTAVIILCLIILLVIASYFLLPQLKKAFRNALPNSFLTMSFVRHYDNTGE